ELLRCARHDHVAHVRVGARVVDRRSELAQERVVVAVRRRAVEDDHADLAFLLESHAHATINPMATMIIESERTKAASGKTYEVRNPATGEVVDQVPAGGAEDVDRAAQAAAKAFPPGRSFRTTSARRSCTRPRSTCSARSRTSHRC